MVRDNPVRGIPFLKEKPRQRWLTYTEEERLMSVCDPWLKELVIMALNTGMRSSEILSLTKANLDFDRKVITVFHTKNDEPKSIPMTEAVCNLLKSKTGQGRLFREINTKSVSSLGLLVNRLGLQIADFTTSDTPLLVD